jgi:hypothetical protein
MGHRACTNESYILGHSGVSLHTLFSNMQRLRQVKTCRMQRDGTHALEHTRWVRDSACQSDGVHIHFRYCENQAASETSLLKRAAAAADKQQHPIHTE